MDPIQKSYGLHPDFERVVLWYCASNKRFWSRIGKELNPDMLSLPHAKSIVAVCRQVTRETGAGPGSTLIIIQHLQNIVSDGKFTREAVGEIYDMFEIVEDGSPPDLEATVGVLVPVVRNQMHLEAIEASHNDFAKKGDFSVPMGLLDKAHHLGKRDDLAGIRLDASAGFAAIAHLQTVSRLSSSVMELDLGLSGGLVRKGLGVWVGGPGAGKSMALASGAAEAVRNQIFTGFPTLELGEARQLARLYANLTGVPTNDIIELESARFESARRMEMISNQIGMCEVAEFPAHTTTVSALIEWIDQKEQDAGQKMEALFVDYADKLTHTGLGDANEYTIMRYVYEALRHDIAIERDMWVYTGSQSTRPSKESQKRIGLHHLADSIHKGRIADLVVTMTRDEDTGEIKLFVAKHRDGRAEFSVGPLATDFEHGRLTPVTSELADWGTA